MKIEKLDNMMKGWFVGNFEPTLYRTNDVEVAIKKYKAGDSEQAHYHKIATEITVIVEGEVKMNNLVYRKGDIIVIEPNEATDFLAVTDTVTAVVKIPGANDDKYLKEEIGHKIKVIIPMAGRGSRFLAEAHRNPEYKNPKPVIDIAGHPMVKWAVHSLPGVQNKNLIFLVLKEHVDNFQIDQKLKEIFSDEINIVVVDKLTEGAACTVLLAKHLINNDDPLIVSDSDHYFDGEKMMDELNKYSDIDGMIPVFYVPEKETKWSYSKEDENGFVTQVAEKVPISTNANIGGYYFGKGSDFVKAAEEMIASNGRVNNEFYVAPVYNYLIKNGGKVRLARPDFVYGLGTPKDAGNFIGLVKQGKITLPVDFDKPK